MALPGCARHADRPAVEVPVAVAVTAPLPPADLMACADRPAGLPEDASLIAQIPTAIRAGIIRMARAFRSNADGKDRLVNWLAPDSCPVVKPAP
jgi:hypothetical protein